ncbi:MAG: HEAT repeat domain-containing protein [Alphaproteobacteria bacterium]|nr:HEAT repeat domain-containing protein [Alphaproteobacteria bacterium]
MDPAVDPFSPLLRMLARYRRDVHQLNPGASEDAIRAAERHLGHRLPLTLAGFLRRWNGGSLFRGALCLRGTSELAAPADELPGLVAFADVPGGRQWVYGPDGLGAWIFGELVEGRLAPQHDRFDRWLNGTLRLFDEDIRDADKELDARLDVDPMSGHLLLSDGERALAQGDPDRAARCFNQATAADPGLIRAWQRLGEVFLSEQDRSQARFALLKALRGSRLPLPYPGAVAIEAGALRTLERLFEPTDAAWERELRSLLDERIQDARGADDAALFEAATLALSRVMLAHGAREQARGVLATAVERARSFAWRAPLPRLTLALVDIETDLGHHDDAERHLRPLLRPGDDRLRGQALLALGRIAVNRQEPWAEEILDEARPHLSDHGDLARCALLTGERHMLYQRTDKAAQAFRAADGHAVRSGDPALQGQVCVGLGDLARLSGATGEAAEAYDAAAQRAAEAGDRELRSRVLLRQGMLAAREGRLGQARDLYRMVADGYKTLELPVREGWARLRVARAVGPDTPDGQAALRRARELFTRPAVRLAAGVGALDALTGDPARSLSWHLECAAEYARDRQEAQRARPPMTRADADRPERRLGAHRIAIGAGNLGVVTALEAELERLARELRASNARAADPKVTGYIAATDLLAYHRSFEAAQVLLRQLFERSLPDAPARALKGAVTRSPNAALVDGLLEAVESPGDPRATAAAAEVLGWRREAAAAPALRALLSQDTPRRVRKAVVVALGRIGDRDAIDPLLEVLEVPELAEDVAVALLLLGDRRGVDFHGQSLASGRELANPPGEIVGRYGGPSYLLLLLGAAEDSDPAKAMGALQGLGYLGDPRAMPQLLGALGHRDRAIVSVACGALELLTGHREDPDEPGVHARWERWWEQSCDGFAEGVRHRYGERLSPSLLAEKLLDDDPLVRRGAFDELVITTGAQLPFDADGPWRVQVAHQRAWRRWCAENADLFPPGRWSFHGQTIG